MYNEKNNAIYYDKRRHETVPDKTFSKLENYSTAKR